MHKFMHISFLGFITIAAASALAMPTRTELERAMPSVREAMAGDWAAMMHGEQTLADTAEASAKRAVTAASDAERFLYFKGAVDMYMRLGANDKVCETLADMCKAFSDIDDETLREILWLAGCDAEAVERIAANTLATILGPWNIPPDFATPLVRTLELGNNVEISFAAIPSGTYNMSNAGGGKSHVVSITHPFWISRTFVTVRQLDAMTPGEPKRHNFVTEEYEAVFPDMDIAAFRFTARDYDKICAALNVKFADILPPNYEFRLPTEAELEYAMRQGNGKAQLYYAESSTKSLCEKRGVKAKGDIRVLPRTSTNSWGVVGGFIEANHTLDGLDIGKAHKAKLWHGQMLVDDAPVNEVAAYTDGEIDPVRRGGYRMVRFKDKRRILAKGHIGLARIVLAPCAKYLTRYPAK